MLNTAEMQSKLKMKAQCVMLSLLAINFIVIGITAIVAIKYPVIISPAFLSYTFGLRHAVDADHIAAIDNVVRKLLTHPSDQTRNATISTSILFVGLYFSLGHSTVVFLLSVVVSISTSFLQKHLQQSQAIGAVVGTAVSALFLFFIGLVNAIVFVQLLKEWRQRKQGTYVEPQEDRQEHDKSIGGFFTKCCPGVFSIVDKSWKMFPLGFLFGLGFDTASEVALLGISAVASHQGLPTPIIILFPLLFTCGMSLIDTMDGILMLWAYGWAFVHPVKKIIYNLFLTGTSAFVAIFVGLVETVGILVDKLHLKGVFWTAIYDLSTNFELLGFMVIGLFFVSFLLSYCLYKQNCHQNNNLITSRTPESELSGGIYNTFK